MPTQTRSLTFLLERPSRVSTTNGTSPSDEPTPAEPATPEIPKEELRLAMKAFRKRLKLTRLDDESRLGYGPMSSGGKSGVAAIRPPDSYPKAVWLKLAEQGKLRREGGGLYSINE
ncbi:hypothetical protein FHS27_004836 [Rhodopirellula rubra]|uniref:Uncharacterized protein n=1 Tax=Aporhodopirellula rubra TaxID=980271 RepID=A0A7W5H6W7_9BACT|nr:hypothetical protein [Aporhodopirellula rubra]